MKDVKKLKKKFIESCNSKLTKSSKNYFDISKGTGISENTIKEFFSGKSNAKIETVIKILNSLNCELKI